MPKDVVINSLAAVLGCDDVSAREIAEKLAAHDIYLMHWPEHRSPKSIKFTSLTAAGPINIKATDIDLGVRLVLEASLTQVALVVNLQYPDAGMLGSWLVTRGVKAQARKDKAA